MLGLKIKRLNRLTYFLTILVSMFLFVGIGLILGFLINAVIGSQSSEPSPFGIVPFIILWFIYYGVCTIKRFNDLGMSGWWTIAAFVPYLNFIIGIILLFKPGTNDSNKYGETPDGTSVMGLKIR